MSCTKLQLPPEPLTKGLPPPDPGPLCPLPSTEFVGPPRKKFVVTPLMHNTVIVADGKNTTLRNIFCVTQETETKQKHVPPPKKNIRAARLGLPLADRYSQPVLKQSASYNTLYI